MTNRRYRVLLVCSHPVPYSAPILKRMAQDPRLDIQVAYCSLQGIQQEYDPEFGIALSWDTPMLVGHPWVSLPNRSWRPGTNRFWGLVNPGLWRLIQKGKFDAVSVYTGYMCASYWIAVFAAMLCGCPVVVSDKVGAQQDLVTHGKTGFVFAARDVQALSQILRNALRDLPRLEPIRVAARAQMDHWSPEENVNSFVAALEKALARHAVPQ